MGKLTADSQQSRGEVEKFKSSRVQEFESEDNAEAQRARSYAEEEQRRGTQEHSPFGSAQGRQEWLCYKWGAEKRCGSGGILQGCNLT
jgi:hypothetical protein